MEKVKLPREVADAIDYHVSMGPKGIFDFVAQWDKHEVATPQLCVIHDYYKNEDPFKLAYALVNGYEVEQTPEDALRKYFNLNRPHETETKDSFNIKQSTSDAIVRTLEILNIKIEGVNA